VIGMEDVIIRVNKTNFSLRKILKESGWKAYCNSSEKVRDLARLKVRIDLAAMEIGFAKLDKMFAESEAARNDRERIRCARCD